MDKPRRRCIGCAVVNRSVQTELARKLKSVSPIHPSVLALQKQKGKILSEVKAVHGKAESLLGRALPIFVDKLRFERQDNGRMQSYRNGVLFPLLSITEYFACADWKNRISRRRTWTRVISANPSAVRSGFSVVVDWDSMSSLANLKLGWSPQKQYAVVRKKGVVEFWDRKKDVMAVSIANAEWTVPPVFSPSERYLITTQKDKSVLWHMDRGKVIFSKVRPAGVSSIAFSPTEKYLLTQAKDKAVLWHVQNGKEALAITLPSRTTPLVFCRNDQYVATRRNDKSVLWHIKSRRKMDNVEIMSIDDRFFWSVAFSPNSKQLAVGKYGNAKILDLETGRTKLNISEPLQHIFSVAFSPDGKYLTTASKSMAKVWDVNKGTELRQFKIPVQFPKTVVLSPNGNYGPFQ